MLGIIDGYLLTGFMSVPVKTEAVPTVFVFSHHSGTMAPQTPSGSTCSRARPTPSTVSPPVPPRSTAGGPTSATWRPSVSWETSPGKCSTVLSLISICVYLPHLLNTQNMHLNLHFNLQFCSVQNGFQVGNNSPPHLSPNLHFN